MLRTSGSQSPRTFPVVLTSADWIRWDFTKQETCFNQLYALYCDKTHLVVSMKEQWKQSIYMFFILCRFYRHTDDVPCVQLHRIYYSKGSGEAGIINRFVRLAAANSNFRIKSNVKNILSCILLLARYWHNVTWKLPKRMYQHKVGDLSNSFKRTLIVSVNIKPNCRHGKHRVIIGRAACCNHAAPMGNLPDTCT